MKKPAENRKAFIMTLLSFSFVLAMLSSLLIAAQIKAENRPDNTEDIDRSRLEKFTRDVDSGKISRIDPGIKGGAAVRGNDGNQGGAGVSADQSLGSCIHASATNVPIGTSVTYSIPAGFSFGQGLSEARIIWKASRDGQTISRRSIPMFPQNTGGVVKNINNADFDVRSDQAGSITVSMEIEYRALGAGSNQFQTASATPVTTLFNAGVVIQNPDGGGGPQNGGPGAVVANPNAPAGSGKVMSCKIPLEIEKIGTPETKELTPNTWKFKDPNPALEMPKSEPGRAHALIKAAVTGTGALKIDYNKEMKDDDTDTDFDSSPTGKKYKRGGIPVGGDGPDPNTLEPHWKVKYPTMSLAGGNWSAAYPREVLSDQVGKTFTFTMPEPTEPFCSLIELRVKHTYINYDFSSNQGGVNQARNMYVAIQNRSAFSVPGGAYDISYTGPELSVVGGYVNGRGQDNVVAIVTGTVKYSIDEGGQDDDPDKPGDQSKPATKHTYTFQNNPTTFICGKVKSSDEGKVAEVATLYEKVLDITAPKIEFLSGSSIRSNCEVDCGSGDLVLIRVKVSDNNKYNPIRIPFLTYETAPGQQCGIPLRMEPGPGTPDASVAQRPFASGNIGIYYSLAPVPINIKGNRAIKWHVDAFDGAAAQHQHDFLNAAAFGNHNRGDFFDGGKGYDGNGPAPERHMSDPSSCGYLSIYDNDRPNINIKMWKVDRGGMYVVGDFTANEDYMLEDCYYRHTPPPPDPVCNIADSQDGFGAFKGYKGAIPDDTVLLRPVAPGSVFPYFPPTTFYSPSRANAVNGNLANQIEDKNCNKFKFMAGFGAGQPGNCPVVFEDVKYLFTVDADDNIDTLSNSGVMQRIPTKLDKLKFSFQFNDKYSNPDRNMAAEEEITFDQSSGLAMGASEYTKMWYLGPIDPSIPLAPGASMAKEVPVFEHIFHNVTPAQYGVSNPDPGCSLKISVMDCSGHWRHMTVYFKVKEVSNELRVLEEKVKRDHRASAQTK